MEENFQSCLDNAEVRQEGENNEKSKNKICAKPDRTYACGKSANGSVCISDRKTCRRRFYAPY